MEKVFITFTNNGTDKAQVEGIFNMDYLDPEQQQNGVEIDKELLPSPEYKSRKTPVLYINPQTNELWYEYIECKPTPEEQIEDIKFQNAQIIYTLVMNDLM